MDERDVLESRAPGPPWLPPTWLAVLVAGIVGVGAGADLMYDFEQDSTPTPDHTGGRPEHTELSLTTGLRPG